MTPAADAGPSQPSECPTCGSRNPFDYNYSCHKNADGWHRANWNLTAPPVPQEAAPRECDCEECASRLATAPQEVLTRKELIAEIQELKQATALDWAMRVAEQIWDGDSEAQWQTPEDWIRSAAALIREAGSERERELRAEISNLESVMELAGLKRETRGWQNVRAESAEAALRQINECVNDTNVAWEARLYQIKRYVQKATKLAEASRLLGRESK